MKQKTIAILLTIALLAGCNTPAPAAPSAAEPDMEAIIQQSVDEAVKERLEQIEEEQRKKDEEIAKLKEQLEELTSQQEAPPEESSSAPAENASRTAQTMGYDVDWSLWFAEAFNEYRNVAGGGSISSDGSTSKEEPDEEENSQQSGAFLEDNALEVVRLVNEERAKQGLEPLDVDENLMELARIRAEELEGKFSHERPDGTHIAQTFSGGENIAGDHPSPSAVMEAWMGSEGHRNNILRERFHYIGVGCYQDANGDLYWVQLFSPRKT